MAYAVTLNEPNLPRSLSWVDRPPFVRDLERAALEAASAAAGVERCRQLHSCIGMVPPGEYEHTCYRSQIRQDAPA
ncbi:hypothetical protein FBY41_0117 [Humibacillus xanthopallidus]|uniref:Uncharacterized protein n=1 Tax=Humibacillus xanthopallidus TaxID=412689 RepID=A0A543HZJ2_9MICO|nr:hypothetical protein FBY41_0117 [Humibacillus xanthopallidus]